MKLAKYPKYISAKQYKNIDGSISYGIPMDLFEKETEYSFQIKKDKLNRDLYYNQVLYIRQNTTICNVCGNRRWKKDIKKNQNSYNFHPTNKCLFCKESKDE